MELSSISIHRQGSAAGKVQVTLFQGLGCTGFRVYGTRASPSPCAAIKGFPATKPCQLVHLMPLPGAYLGTSKSSHRFRVKG